MLVPVNQMISNRNLLRWERREGFGFNSLAQHADPESKLFHEILGSRWHGLILICALDSNATAHTLVIDAPDGERQLLVSLSAAGPEEGHLRIQLILPISRIGYNIWRTLSFLLLRGGNRRNRRCPRSLHNRSIHQMTRTMPSPTRKRRQPHSMLFQRVKS